jgi:hypothetical protein
MPSKDVLISLIGLSVEARCDHGRTITKGKLLDVGTKSIFIRPDRTVPGSDSVSAIDLSKLSSIKYMKEEDIQGPFDGRREPGDNRGG